MSVIHDVSMFVLCPLFCVTCLSPLRYRLLLQTPTSSHRNRCTQPAAGTSALPLQREGSFKLEQVNEDYSAGAGDKNASRNPYSTQNSQRGAQRSSRDGNRGPKDLNHEQKLGAEEDDEATVGLGQADFLDAQLRNTKYNSTTTTTTSATANNKNVNVTRNKNVHGHDIGSASSEFPPGVVALGSDNKPTYKPDVVYSGDKGGDEGNGKDSGGGGRQGAAVSDDNSTVSSSKRDVKSMDRNRDRDSVREGERKFDAADFVSNNNTPPANNGITASTGSLVWLSCCGRVLAPYFVFVCVSLVYCRVNQQ